MKKRMIAVLLTAALLAIVTSPNTAFAAEDDAEVSAAEPVMLSGADTYNADGNYYTPWSDTVKSYLTELGDGTLERVEYSFHTQKLIVEDYSADAKTLRSSRTLTMELPVFGGFFSGQSYNFVVFGQENLSEDNSREVMRVVKFSKSWERVASASVYGANTYIPFDAGSLRMAESGSTLYIHTCHKMYADNCIHHQANMSYRVNEQTMSVVESNFDVTNIYWTGYVSHSFNQFVRTDGNYLYRVDHGDANPRAISLTKVSNTAIKDNVKVALPVDLGNTGAKGNNATGVSVGGFELASDSCLIAFNAVDYNKPGVSPDSVRNIYISRTDKNLSSTSVTKFTDFDDNSGVKVNTPQLVRLDGNRFLLMWEEINTEAETVFTKLAVVNDRGQVDSQGIVTTNYMVSDCQPVVTGGGLVKWYAGMGTSPYLYTVDPSNLAASAGGQPQQFDFELNITLDKDETFTFPDFGYSKVRSRGASGSSEFFEYIDDDYKSFTAKEYCSGTVSFHFSNGRDLKYKITVHKALKPAPKLDKAIDALEYGVLVLWEPVPNAVEYYVYRKTEWGDWMEVDAVKADDNSRQIGYVDNYVESGKTYTYTVRESDGCGDFISEFDPQGVSATYIGYANVTKTESTKDGVKLSWNQILIANVYAVFRLNSEKKWDLLGTTADTFFTDKTAENEKTYTYTVCCVDDEGELYSGYKKDGWTYTYRYYKLSAPKLRSAENTANGIKISWDKVAGAKVYQVCVKDGDTWKALANTTDTSYVDKTAAYGKQSTYTVRCVDVSDSGKATFTSPKDETGKSAVFVYLGDVNGDRKINVRDRICLARHLAKWSGYADIIKEAADANADGVVNAKDRVVLTRYLAKWSGYSKLPCKK